MLKKIGIYTITHVESGKRYIGSSVDINRRFSQHVRALNNNRHHCIKLQLAWNKYGILAFRFHVVDYVEQEDLLVGEQQWIDTIKPEYNISLIAGRSSGFKDKSHSIESRVKISIGCRGIKHSQESVERVASKNRGRKHTTEARIKISKGSKGISRVSKTPEDTKSKQSEAAKKVWVKRKEAGWSPKPKAPIKIRVYVKGIPRSVAVRNKISTANKGKPKSIEHRYKLALAKMGKKLSEETKNKMSETRRGKPWTEARRKAQSERKSNLR